MRRFYCLINLLLVFPILAQPCIPELRALGVYYSSEMAGVSDDNSGSTLVRQARTLLIAAKNIGSDEQEKNLLMMEWYVQLLSKGTSLGQKQQVRILFREISGHDPSDLVELVFRQSTEDFQKLVRPLWALEWYRLYRTSFCFEPEDNQKLDLTFKRVFGTFPRILD